MNRRSFLGFVGAGAAGALLTPALARVGRVAGAAETAPYYQLGTNRHLFLDSFLLDKIESAVIIPNPPRPAGLVMIAEEAWERGGITAYCNVFRDTIAGEYRLYYVPVDFTEDPPFWLCLARSKDGISWEKPALGAVEWKGSTANNIVIRGQREGTVFIDPNGSGDRQYVYLSSESRLKTRLFTSPDGIRWTMQPEQIWSGHSDSQISTFWDGQLGKYVHYPRLMYFPNPPSEVGRERRIARVETDTIDQAWPQPTLIMAPDLDDPPETDLYTNSVQKYGLADSAYLAFPTPYYHYDVAGRTHLSVGQNDGVIETQIATSRDSRNWIRYRMPFVPLGSYDGLSIKIAMVFPGLLYHEDRIDQYFAGYTFTHGDRDARTRLSGRALGGIFRLEHRIDGFLSLDFAIRGGSVVTAPFFFEGRSLALNLNTSASGELRVEIQTAGGDPISGFALSDCDVINGDYLTRPVTWKGTDDLSPLAGQAIRLRFVARGTKLYSFWFEGQAPAHRR